MNRDGSGERKLVELEGNDPYNLGFDWSPDGSRLVFSDRPSGSASYDLFVVDVSSGNVTPLTADGDLHEEAPDWSPTGDSVTYQAESIAEPAGEDVYRISTEEGAQAARLTTAKGDDYEPRWSPDGSVIAFFSTRDEADNPNGPYFWDIYAVDAAGGKERQITDQSTRKTDLAWSPDGEMIAYNSRCDDDLCDNDYDDNIYVVTVDTGVERRLTSDGQRPEVWPTWSPNSRWVAYSLVLRGGRDLDLGASRVSDRKAVRLTSSRRRSEGEAAWAVT
jgi:Tol biopolymer transport system component